MSIHARRALGVATVIGLTVLLLACGAAQARERTVLVLTETNGFRHDSIADGRRLLRELGRESSAYDVVVLTKSSALTPRRLDDADALVLLNTSGKLQFCEGCPPNYKAPKPCYRDYTRKFDGEGAPPQYDYTDCYEEYPHPPAVKSDEPEAEVEQDSLPPPEAQPRPQPQAEPPATEGQTTPAPHQEQYCYEADSPDRFEPGCQGTLGPPP